MKTIAVAPGLIRETMGRIDYFRDWDAEQIARLAGNGRFVTLQKKEQILCKGEALDSLYVLISGQAKLFIPLPNGMERILNLVDPGEGFGEASLLLHEPSPYDVVANRECHVLLFNGMAFRRELQQSPLLMERTLSLLARQMLALFRDMEDCAQPSSVQKVACYLLRHQPSPDTVVYELSLPSRKRDVASKLGLTHETFSRVLSFLGREGVISMRGSHIQVADGERLRRLNPVVGSEEAA